MTARAYHSAMDYFVCEVNAPGKHHLGAPYALLEGFALECAFKAVACAGGWSEQAVRDLGHNLTKALDAALDCGLKLSDPDGVRKIVATMQKPHKDLLVRYIPADRESITLPNPHRALSVISQLIEDVIDQFPAIESEMPG